MALIHVWLISYPIIPLLLNVSDTIPVLFVCLCCCCCCTPSPKKSTSSLGRTGRPFTPAVSPWAPRSVRSSETASRTMGTGQWTSGRRAKEGSRHTTSLWEELEKVTMDRKIMPMLSKMPRCFVWQEFYDCQQTKIRSLLIFQQDLLSLSNMCSFLLIKYNKLMILLYKPLKKK